MIEVEICEASLCTAIRGGWKSRLLSRGRKTSSLIKVKACALEEDDGSGHGFKYSMSTHSYEGFEMTQKPVGSSLVIY